jgi:pulcherriminic acid synthase
VNRARPPSAFDPQMMFDFPDPYPLFAEMRRTAPVTVARVMRRDTYVVTRYDDCLAVLKDAETFSSRSNAEVGKVMGRTLIEMDGKEHTRHRALVQSVFVRRHGRPDARLAEMVTRCSTRSCTSARAIS